MINVIRKFARSWEYQTLFSTAKNMSLGIFAGKKEFNKIQLLFFHWQAVYSSLLEIKGSGMDFIPDDMLNDDIRVNAYLYAKMNQKKSEEENESFYNLHKSPKINMDRLNAWEFTFLTPKKKSDKGVN